MPESRAARLIRESFQSGRPLTYVHTPEEQRVAGVLQEVSRGTLDSEPLPVWTWSLTEGMRCAGQSAAAGATTARGALDFIVAFQGPAIFHLKDFHEPLRESADIRRRLRDVYESCRDLRKFVVISSPVRYLPEEIERSVLFLELRPPDLVELVEFLRSETSAPEDVLQQVGAGAARPYPRRIALRSPPCPGWRTAARFRLAAGAAGRKAAAGQPQRRDRICGRRHAI